jgi:type IV secretion system protein TrbL
MALRRADLGEFAERQSFAVFCGVFWWLLINGPAIGIAIIEGLLAGCPSIGPSNNLSPHRGLSILDLTFSAKPMKNFR